MMSAIEACVSAPQEAAGGTPRARMNVLPGASASFAPWPSPRPRHRNGPAPTDLVELAGTALLRVPGARVRGGLLLAATMARAILPHLAPIGGSPAPAAVLFASFVFVAWRPKPRPRGALTG